MSELKAHSIIGLDGRCNSVDNVYYLTSEADKVIAELKDKCQMHDFFWEGCGFAKRGFKNTIAVSEAFDRLEAENAELKQKLEDAKATAYAESVDAGMRERRMRWALWRAIALFCARSCEYFSGIMSHCLMGQDDLYRRCEEKKNKYLHATYKCRAKMEEYK